MKHSFTTMTYITYSQLKETFDDENDAGAFRCLGRPSKEECGEEIASPRKELARRLLSKEEDELLGEERTDIIVLLLCERCQQTYTQRTNIKQQWLKDSPGIDFGIKGSPSPYSLHPKRAASRTCRSSNSNSSPTSAPTSAPTRASLVVVSQGPCSSPTESVASRRRRRRRSTGGCSSSSRTQNANSLPTIFPDPGDAYTEAHNGRDELPLSRRSRHEMSDSDSRQQSLLAEERSVRNEGQADNNLTSEVVQLGTANETIPPTPPGSAAEQLTSAGDTNPFRHGRAYDWEPCTLRSRVLDIFWRPLLEKRGSIYAVQVRGRPYVKIGRTTQPLDDRLRQIEREHGQELDVSAKFSKSNITLLQLERLEKLVKAFLGYYQMDLPCGNAIHAEYFEISLAQAEKTIHLFMRLMETHGVEPGKDVDPKVSSAIQSSPALRVDTLRGNSPMTESERRRINSDLDLQIRKLETAFGQGRARFKWPRQGSNGLGMFCFVILLHLPDILNPSYRLFYPALCMLLIFMFRGSTLTEGII